VLVRRVWVRGGILRTRWGSGQKFQPTQDSTLCGNACICDWWYSSMNVAIATF